MIIFLYVDRYTKCSFVSGFINIKRVCEAMLVYRNIHDVIAVINLVNICCNRLHKGVKVFAPHKNALIVSVFYIVKILHRIYRNYSATLTCIHFKHRAVTIQSCHKHRIISHDFSIVRLNVCCKKSVHNVISKNQIKKISKTYFCPAFLILYTRKSMHSNCLCTGCNIFKILIRCCCKICSISSFLPFAFINLSIALSSHPASCKARIKSFLDTEKSLKFI